MSAKKHEVVIVAIIVLIGVFAAIVVVSRPKPYHPNTVDKVMGSIKAGTSTGSYDDCSNLFLSKDKLTKDTYNTLKDIFSYGYHYSRYNSEVLTDKNGKKWLILITPKKVNGAFKIVDVLPLSK